MTPSDSAGWMPGQGVVDRLLSTPAQVASPAAGDIDPQPGWRAGIEASIRRLEAQSRKPRDLWHAAYFAAIDEALVHLRAMLARGTERAGDTVAAETQPAATEPSALDAETFRRLARAAAEDDARMTGAPWRPCSCGLCGLVWSTKDDVIVAANACDGDRGRQEDSDGIARTRNNLPAIARQLTAAADLAERADSWRVMYEAAEAVNGQIINARDRAVRERDAAQAECERLRKDLSEERDRVETMKAEVWEANEDNFKCGQIAAAQGCLVANAPSDAVRTLANRYIDAQAECERLRLQRRERIDAVAFEAAKAAPE